MVWAPKACCCHAANSSFVGHALRFDFSGFARAALFRQLGQKVGGGPAFGIFIRIAMRVAVIGAQACQLQVGFAIEDGQPLHQQIERGRGQAQELALTESEVDAGNGPELGDSDGLDVVVIVGALDPFAGLGLPIICLCFFFTA